MTITCMRIYTTCEIFYEILLHGTVDSPTCWIFICTFTLETLNIDEQPGGIHLIQTYAYKTHKTIVNYNILAVYLPLTIMLMTQNQIKPNYVIKLVKFF